MRMLYSPWGWSPAFLISLIGGVTTSSAWGQSIIPESDIPKLDILDPVATSASILINPVPPSSAIQQTVQQAYLEHFDPADIPYIPYLAAPENLNPGLYIPPEPEPEPEPPEPEPEPLEPTTDEDPFIPVWEVDGLTVNFSDDFSNFGQNNRFFEPTITGVLPNSDRLSVTTGFNSFIQPDVASVHNIPIKVAWTRKMGDFTTTLGGGVDLFNRLPIEINLDASTSVPVWKQATLSFFVEHETYKFNATTLNNQIKYWRYGPNLFWQIAPDLSFFSLVRWGHYNDGNLEQQSFSRLEKTFGDFSLAANVFNWSYQENLESASGYFSPADFLVANGEVAWKDQVFDWLDCRVAASWGRQRLAGQWTSAYSYGGKCSVQVLDTLAIDLGYAFSNVVSQTGGSAFNNRSITGQIRAQF